MREGRIPFPGAVHRRDIAAAILCVVAAFAVRWLLLPALGSATPFITFYPALTLAALTLSHQVRIWHLFLSSLLLGTTNAFDNPARQVFVARVVPRADLMNGVALNSSRVTGARIAGPALIEEHASTTVLAPGDTLEVDVFGNLDIAIGSDRT